MTLSMRQAGQLGGFLHLGPHYFPERRNGVQIIMRGPHGQRLAANPVYLRRHNQPRGSGFRFWVEELNIPADVEWNPQQVVTGVMGMGDLPAGWACPYTRAQLGEEISKIESAVRMASNPASLEAVRAQKERLLECHMQLGQGATYKSHWDRITRVGNLILLKKGRVTTELVDPATGEMLVLTEEEYCRQNPSACFPEDKCAPYDVACLAGEWWDRNWWKIALGVGGVIVLYGVAGGVGRGLVIRKK